MDRRLLEQSRPMRRRATFGIGRAVIEPPDARMGNCARAHRAGLQRYVEIAAVQPIRAERSCGIADCGDFGMGGRIVIGDRTVAAAPDNFASLHDDGTDGNFARIGRRWTRAARWAAGTSRTRCTSLRN